MSSTSSKGTILERLCFIQYMATYLIGTCGIDSLEEIAYLDGEDDVDTTIKDIASPLWTVKKGSRTSSVTSCNNDIHVSIRAAENLKLCVYYLKHMERVQRKPVVNTINLVLVRIYHDQQRHEVSFKKTVWEPVINDN
jgi:hypothetical protein